MKPLVLILFYFLPTSLFAQGDSVEYYKTVDFLNRNGIAIRSLAPFDNYIVYFNCDSVLFLKKVSGDTIKIWTASISIAYEYTQAKKLAARKSFGKTQYLEVMGDGRIFFTIMHETEFIHRNDSLFEFSENSPKKYKLIFSPTMFSDSLKKVKLKKDVNYMKDEIELENTWIQNGKTNYTIRINNKYKKEETSYSYTFSEDMVFLLWENCIKDGG